jgi:GTPase SAR1 family protein
MAAIDEQDMNSDMKELLININRIIFQDGIQKLERLNDMMTKYIRDSNRLIQLYKQINDLSLDLKRLWKFFRHKRFSNAKSIKLNGNLHLTRMTI